MSSLQRSLQSQNENENTGPGVKGRFVIEGNNSGNQQSGLKEESRDVSASSKNSNNSKSTRLSSYNHHSNNADSKSVHSYGSKNSHTSRGSHFSRQSAHSRRSVNSNRSRKSNTHKSHYSTEYYQPPPICKFFGTKQGCKTGAECRFLHTQEACSSVKGRERGLSIDYQQHLNHNYDNQSVASESSTPSILLQGKKYFPWDAEVVALQALDKMDGKKHGSGTPLNKVYTPTACSSSRDVHMPEITTDEMTIVSGLTEVTEAYHLPRKQLDKQDMKNHQNQSFLKKAKAKTTSKPITVVDSSLFRSSHQIPATPPRNDNSSSQSGGQKNHHDNDDDLRYNAENPGEIKIGTHPQVESADTKGGFMPTNPLSSDIITGHTENKHKSNISVKSKASSLQASLSKYGPSTKSKFTIGEDDIKPEVPMPKEKPSLVKSNESILKNDSYKENAKFSPQNKSTENLNNNALPPLHTKPFVSQMEIDVRSSSSGSISAVSENNRHRRVPSTADSLSAFSGTIDEMQYRAHVFVQHDSNGLLLLKRSKKRKGETHFQVPAINFYLYDNDSDINMKQEERILQTGRRAAARALYSNTGLDVVNDMQRLRSKHLLDSEDVNSTSSFLYCEMKQRHVFFILKVSDDDFAHFKGNSTADCESIEEVESKNIRCPVIPINEAVGCELRLNIGSKFAGFLFEKDLNTAATMLKNDCGGVTSAALDSLLDDPNRMMSSPMKPPSDYLLNNSSTVPSCYENITSVHTDEEESSQSGDENLSHNLLTVNASKKHSLFCCLFPWMIQTESSFSDDDGSVLSTGASSVSVMLQEPYEIVA